MNQDAVLTYRESQVAELLALGAPKKVIAGKLYISTRTVENHARNIFEKVEVNCVAQLTLWYVCKRFHLSPILTPLLSGVLLLLMITNEFNTRHYMMRRLRTEHSQANAKRFRCDDDFDDDTISI